MEQEPTPATIKLNGELFDVVKPVRLNPGMVLKSQSCEAYARLGPKESVLEEQIHTVSLYERGFPVARVLASGAYDDTQRYFIEESLGDLTFHVQFADEWAANGEISAETFESYRAILQRYINAQFTDKNRTHISAREFVESAIPDSQIVANYALCDKNTERYHQAIATATERLSGVPMGVLQYDLNPFNILEHGMIDFELVGYGPLGYDTLLVSLWHRWFTSDTDSRYSIAYYLSEPQIDSIRQLVDEAAERANLPSPGNRLQEFLLIKSAWGFSSLKPLYDEPESKQEFYHYRAQILERCVESYLKDEPIDPLAFPDIRA